MDDDNDNNDYDDMIRCMLFYRIAMTLKQEIRFGHL